MIDRNRSTLFVAGSVSRGEGKQTGSCGYQWIIAKMFWQVEGIFFIHFWWGENELSGRKSIRGGKKEGWPRGNRNMFLFLQYLLCLEFKEVASRGVWRALTTMYRIMFSRSSRKISEVGMRNFVLGPQSQFSYLKEALPQSQFRN